MAISIPQVQSGDVIAANLMNQIVQALLNLDTRVSKLESASTIGGNPHILDFSPKTNLHEGDQLTLTGQNLWAAGVNAVFVDLNGVLTRVTQFAIQSDSQLVFNIPAVFAQASGSWVSIRVVSPTQGSDAVSFTLFPAVVTIPTGDIRIQLAAPPNTTFNPGTGAVSASYTLNYTINASTTLGDTYDLIPTVTGAGWTASVANPTLFIEAQQSLSQPTIKMGTLTLTIPPGATGSATLKLEVKSHLNPVLDKFSPPAAIPVGGTVLLSNGIGVMPEPRAVDVDANGNFLVPLAGLQLQFALTVTASGKTYLLANRFDNDPTNWQATLPSSITIPTANVPAPLTVFIQPNPGAQPSDIYLRVTQQDDTSVVTEVFYPVRVKS